MQDDFGRLRGSGVTRPRRVRCRLMVAGDTQLSHLRCAVEGVAIATRSGKLGETHCRGSRGMSKPEGIYLSADYRVTDARSGDYIHDEAIKHLTIHYPPLDGRGPKVLLDFTGMAQLPDGTPTLTWIRETLRGEPEVINQSMRHLLKRLDRYIAPLGRELVINFLVLERYRRLYGGFSNLRKVGQWQVTQMPRFTYMMRPAKAWGIFANGSGARPLLESGRFHRLEPHLGVVPRSPLNHMNLLAVENRWVASKSKGSVSPFCHVSFISATDRFQSTNRSFIERGESAPFEMPFLLGELDMTVLMADHMRNSQAVFKGEISELPQVDKDELNARLKRRP
jgi:hypothetical protein